MKAKLSYKSKRNIVISVIIVALLAVIGTGTYFFTKGNDDTQAFSGDNMQIGESTQNGQTEAQGNEGQEAQSSEQNQGQGENEGTQEPVENNNGEGSTTEGENNPSNQETTTQGQNGRTTGTTTGEVPNDEYVTERVEEQEVLVSEDYLVEWAPLSIEANTTTSNLSIIRPILSAEKTADKTAVRAGEVITYTITVKNSGTADGVALVKDNVPEETTFVAESIKINGEIAKNENGEPLTQTDLANGIEVNVAKQNEQGIVGTSEIAFQVIVNEDVEGVIANVADIDGEETNKIKNPVITFEKKASKTEIKAGDILTYTIEITNTGDVKGTAIVKDSAPDGTTFVAESIKANGTALVKEDGTAYTEEDLKAGILVDVEANGKSTLTFEVTVNDLEDGTKIKNVATVNEGPTNETETEYQEPVLSQEKTANKTAVVKGEELTYTITVTNSGKANGTAIVKDTVPTGTTFVEESIKVNGTTTDKTAEDLANGIEVAVAKNGGTATVSFKVTVSEDATGTLSNKANVNETDTEEVKTPVITFDKAVDKSEAKIGDTLTYTITATNSGEVAGTVTIRDTKPTETTFVKNSLIINNENANYENDEETLSTGISYELQAGETVTVTFQVTINKNVTGTLVNTAYINDKPTDGKETRIESNIIFVENGGTEVADRNGYTGEAIENRDMPTTTRTGYTFAGWYEEDALENEAETLPEKYPAGTTYYYAKWTANAQTYTVNYLEKDTNKVLAQAVTKNTTFASVITGENEKITIEGYTYNSVNPETLTIGINNEENVINVYYTANTDTIYTVEYYYQQNGNYATTTELNEQRTGTTDTTAKVTDADKKPIQNGYVFDENAGNVLSGNIARDGSLVLKVYFKQQYTVTYKPGTQGVFAEQKIENINYGTATPGFKGETTGNTGFYFINWDKTIADTVTEDAIYTALWEGLTVSKTRTAIVDKDNLGNTTFVDQAGDIIKYTITVKNAGDVKATNIELTDDHKVVVTSVKIGSTDVDISNRETNTFTAGKDLLQGLTTEINPGESIEVTVEYTASQTDIDNALKSESKIIVNTATATLNNHEYEGSDKTEGKDGTDVKQRCEYTVEYYFNGKHDETIKNDIHSATIEGATIGFEKPTTLSGYTYIKYVGIDGKDNGSTTAKEGANLIKVYYGKAETSIDKGADKTVNAGTDIDYTITVSNTGYVGTTITVTDELVGTTYVPNSAKVGNTKVEPTITTNKDGNKVLSWEVKLGAASSANPKVSQTITFKSKTDNGTFGDKIDNTAKIDGTDKQDKVSTDVNEINVKYNEFKEGQKGTDLNIIFVLDNSSSMNFPIAGKSYKENKRPIAPTDESKTRLYNAKKAIKDFIEGQNKNPNTDMRVITFNRNSNGTYEDMVTLVKDSDIKERTETRYNWIGIPYTVTIRYVEINGVEYEVSDEKTTGSDGNSYYYVYKPIKYGAISVGTNETSNESLKTAVDNISISSEKSGLGTNIVPAFNLITANKDTYLSDTKKNIVIVLADGSFDDNYNGRALENLEKAVDEIYSIGFGSGNDYDESSLREISTNNTCYTATDSSTLLNKFNEILEEATGTEQSGRTTNGEITFKEATNTIKVSDTCPIEATYDTGRVDAEGKPIMETIFKCTSTTDLAKYGLSINGKVITWDAKKFVENNPDVTVPENVSIKYYIPRS